MYGKTDTWCRGADEIQMYSRDGLSTLTSARIIGDRTESMHEKNVTRVAHRIDRSHEEELDDQSIIMVLGHPSLSQCAGFVHSSLEPAIGNTTKLFAFVSASQMDTKSS
uniref:Uncharacterized protein n=1 Tax=Grammatophora oceanica TaxID=210454 RepID=A0A7S1Y6L1_9STRA